MSETAARLGLSQGCLTLVALCCLVTLVISPQRAAAQVRLGDDGQTWRLTNGLVEATIDKVQATITHLGMPGGPNLVELGYYDTNGSPGGFEKSAGYLRFGRHEPVVAEVAQQSDGLVDLVLRSDPARLDPAFSHPLRTEMHYVMRRDDPGLYVYWLRWHDRDMPPFGMGQTRHVIKAPRSIFDEWQITDERHGVFPTEEEMAGAERAYDATSRLPDGRYVTKYANAVPAADHHLSGLYSSAHQLGLWQINASSEYINGGPTKQNLTIHEEAPFLLHMVQSGHFGGGSAHIEGEWSKLYGPIFFYLNQGGTRDELWSDAKRRVAEEQSQWPYAWVKPLSVADAYPLQRGVVAGTVARPGGESPAGAFAIVGAAKPEWQFQGLGYLYWQRVGEDGAFEVSGVRPSEYTLYVFQPGVFGEGRHDGVVVHQNQVTDVGRLVLSPEANGRLLWQIGTPDRKAAEFRHGDEFRQVYLSRRYPEEFPQDVRFVIGKSSEATDWNYYQPGGKTWRVVFDLERPLASDAVLTIALADSSYRPSADLSVAANGADLGTLEFADGDSALHRLGIYGVYQVRTLRIPTDRLRAGENVLSLTVPHSRAWVMYDFIRMEMAEQ